MTLLVQPLHLALPTKTTSSIALNNNHTAASPKSTPTHQKLQSNNPATTSSYYYSSANAQKNTDMNNTNNTNNTNNNNTNNDNMNHNNINNSEQPTTIIETKTQPITTSQTTVGAEKKAHFLRKRLPEESHKITLVIDMDETLISAHLHPYKRRRNTLQKSTTTESSVNNHMNNKKSTNNGTTPSQEKREFALPSHVYHSSAAASRTTTRRLSFSNLIRGNHPNSNPQNNTPTPNSPARSKIPPSKNGNSPASSTVTTTAALPVLPLPLITSRQVMDPPLPPPSPTSTTPNNDDSHILMMRAIPSAPIACEGNHSLLSREQLIEGRSLSPSSSSLLSTVVTHSVDTDDEEDDDEEEEDEDPLIHGLEYFETEFVSEQGTHERVTVYKRPFLYHFLSQVKQWFEVVLFTSSTQPYADSILDQIEREAELYGATQGASGANGSNAQRNRETINLGKNKVFSERLYRRHCTRVEPMFCLEMFQSTCVVKDLNRLGRDLNKTVIIDNSPSAYKWHTRNAMPVSTWSHTDLDSTTDEELNQLLPYLYQMFISNEIDQSLGQYKSQFRRNDFYEDECGDNQGSCRIS